jgi:prolyl oligopeptidase family protein
VIATATLLFALASANANVTDVTFPGSEPGSQVHAYLVTPKAMPPKAAGVLWVHWLGDPKTTNKTEFLNDAVTLAGDGVVSVLVDAEWSQPKWFMKVRSTDTDLAMSKRIVKDLGLALDYLLKQPGVDPERIAYVGHDFGGMYGSILAKVDGRPKHYVIMAVTTKLSDWFLLGKQPKDKGKYVAQMAEIEPLPFLRDAKAKAFLFQFAKVDKYVTPEHAKEYVEAAPGEKRVEYYEADHDLDVPKAHADRLDWLRQKLR